MAPEVDAAAAAHRAQVLRTAEIWLQILAWAQREAARQAKEKEEPPAQQPG